MERKRTLRWFYIISTDMRKLVSWGWGWGMKKGRGETVCRGWVLYYIYEGEEMRLRFHTCCYLQPSSKLRLPRALPSPLCIFIFPPLPELIPLSFNSVIAEQESARVSRIVLSYGSVQGRKLSRKCKWAAFKGIFMVFGAHLCTSFCFIHTLMCRRECR